MSTVRRVSVALVVLFVALASASATTRNRATTVIIVRHAEKATEPKDDPPLTEAGRVRAAALARMVSAAGVVAVVTSQFARTRETGATVASRLGLTPVAVSTAVDPSTKLPTPAATRSLVDEIRKHAGGTVVVVGHSNTIPALVVALGGPPGIVIDEARFDDVFVVTVTGRTATVARLKYGAGT